MAFLEQLLGAEVAATAARRHTARLKLAGFPAPWWLADFDSDAQPKLDEALMRDLARFVDEAANVLFVGSMAFQQDARYNALQTADAFRARLRDTVDLQDLSTDLLSTVARTVQPAHATVWLRRMPT